MPIHYARRLTGRSRSAAADRHLGYVLAAMAGAVNATGFAVLRHYTSHMTGMVSTFGERLVAGEPLLAAAAALAIVTFAGGATCCTVMIHHARRHRLQAEFALPLLLESTVILAVVVLNSSGALRSSVDAWATICALTFTMGLQNALITKISRGEIRTTHVTGIVTDLGIEWGRGIAKLLDLRAEAGIPGRARLLATLLLSFAAGCVGGTLAAQRVGLLALLPVALVIGVLALVPAFDDLKRRSPDDKASATTDTTPS